MPTTLQGRLAAIRGRIGWRVTTLTDGKGRLLDVESGLLIDAWLDLVLKGWEVRLPPRVHRFLLTSRVRRVDGEVLIAVREDVRRQERERKERMADMVPATTGEKESNDA